MKKVYTIDETMAEYRQQFYNLYHQTIAPMFREFEKERKTSLITAILLSIFLLFISVIVALDMFGISGNTPKTSDFAFVLKAIISITAFILAIVVPFYFNYKFVAKLKYSCMDKILRLFGDVRWYDETDVIDNQDLIASDLFSVFTNRDAYDGFNGVYKDVPFQISETYLYHVSGSGKNKRVVSVFNGVVIKFLSNKDIRNKTIIATKGDNKIRGGANISFLSSVLILIAVIVYSMIKNGVNTATIFSSAIVAYQVLIPLAILYLFVKVFPKLTNKEYLNEIKLEDSEFSKKYKVYSSDQIEGRYLITPGFMERFKNMQTAFGTKNIKCSFYGDSLMFAISTRKNLFEIGNLFCSLENPKQLQTFFNELTSIFILIDYFKLNEETGL